MRGSRAYPHQKMNDIFASFEIIPGKAARRADMEAAGNGTEELDDQQETMSQDAACNVFVGEGYELICVGDECL